MWSVMLARDVECPYFGGQQNLGSYLESLWSSHLMLCFDIIIANCWMLLQHATDSYCMVRPGRDSNARSAMSGKNDIHRIPQ